MFGLSTRERLSKVIINACMECKDVYKNGIMNNIELFDGMENEDDASSLIISIRKEYLDAVVNSVLSSLQISFPFVISRIRRIMTSPGIFGLEDVVDGENGIAAGRLFVICYYAIKNTIPTPVREWIELNHLQNDIMNEVLSEIEGERKQTL